MLWDIESATVGTWRFQDNLWSQLGLSSHHVTPRDQTQVGRLGIKLLYYGVVSLARTKCLRNTIKLGTIGQLVSGLVIVIIFIAFSINSH